MSIIVPDTQNAQLLLYYYITKMRVGPIAVCIVSGLTLGWSRHATLACYKALSRTNPAVSSSDRMATRVQIVIVAQLLRHWERAG